MNTQQFFKKIKLLGFKNSLYWKILNILKIRKLIKINYLNHVFYIRTLSTDIEVILENLEEEYSVATDFFHRKSRNIIIDAGGYIGSSAIIFSKMFPQSKIITLEPEKNNFKILCKNIKPYKNILAINSALIINKEKKNNYSLHSNDGGECGYSLFKNKNKLQMSQKKINAISLNDIKKKYGKKGYKIAILKLDIEGYEKKIFQNEKKFLKGVKIIFVELHDRIIKDCTKEFKNFSKNRFTKKLSGEKYLSAEVF